MNGMWWIFMANEKTLCSVILPLYTCGKKWHKMHTGYVFWEYLSKNLNTSIIPAEVKYWNNYTLSKSHQQGPFCLLIVSSKVARLVCFSMLMQIKGGEGDEKIRTKYCIRIKTTDVFQYDQYNQNQLFYMSHLYIYLYLHVILNSAVTQGLEKGVAFVSSQMAF